MNCNNCGAPLKEGAKFCTRCGAAQSKSTDGSQQNPTPSNSFNVIKQRLYWNIQPGVVAQQIKEADFIQYDTTQGVIINDGTTAYIKAGGKLLAEIKGGCYDFIPSEELNRILETRVSGISSLLRRAGRFVTNLIFGTKIQDKIGDEYSRLKKLETLDQVLKYLKGNELFSVSLKQDREFQLIIGSIQDGPDGSNDFEPMIVRTKHLDLQMAIKGFFRIDNFEEFSNYYLTENSYVSTSMLAKDISSSIKVILQDCLKDTIIEETYISESVKATIEHNMRNINMHGLVLTNLVEIAIQNEAIERMREVAREMYLSEHELSYLQRTNDYRNRLNTVLAQQALHEARTDLEFHQELQKINKDQALSQDELDKFYILLSRERRIWEAQGIRDEKQAYNEINNSLAEIKKTELLRDEEFAILEDKIKEGTITRGFALDLLGLKNAIDYEKIRTGGEQTIDMQELTHQLNKQRMEDEYENERFYTDLKRRSDAAREVKKVDNEQTIFEYDLAERAVKSQMERYQEFAKLEDELDYHATDREMKLRGQEFDHSYRVMQEEQLTERQRLEMQKAMGADQIMAQHIGKMDATAQAAFAQSFAAANDVAREKEIAAEKEQMLLNMLKMQQESSNVHSNEIKEMFSGVMSTVAHMSDSMVQNRDQQRNEYRDQLRREQDRHDAHQDRALNYTTRGEVKIPVRQRPDVYIATKEDNIPQNDIKADNNAPATKKCSFCGKVHSLKERFCDECGSELK